MARHTDDLIKLITAGGDLIINCEKRHVDDVIKLVRTMNNSSFKYTLSNLSNHHTDDLLKIIRACSSKDNITLEV